MKADALVDVLLEMNLINVQDLDREINIKAASIIDPRAAKWFKRVVRYWLINMDKMAAPYVAQAAERNPLRGSKYYHSPNRDSKYPAWIGEWPTDKPNVCEKCKGEAVITDKKTGETVTCKQCRGTGLGEKVYAGGDPCPLCQGKRYLKRDQTGYESPAAEEEPGAFACTNCGGIGLRPEKVKSSKGHEGFFAGESLMRFILGEADELGGYDPKNRTYTSQLHTMPELIECPTCHGAGRSGGQLCRTCGGKRKVPQRLTRDIESNFPRFDPAKAKSKRFYAEPPTKKELEPWMTGPEARGKEFRFVDPLAIRRQDLATRLDDLVQFLNFSAKDLNLQPKLSPDEAENLDQGEIAFMEANRKRRKASAEALFRYLSTADTEDLNGFRDVLSKAEEFAYNIQNKPDLYLENKSGKVIRRFGTLVLRKTTDTETTNMLAKKPAYTPGDVTWCLKNASNASSYLRSGPVYFIEKNGQAYAAIYPAGPQVKNPQNLPLNNLPADEAMEIAQLIAPFQSEIPTECLRHEARPVATAVEQLRRNLRPR